LVKEGNQLLTKLVNIDKNLLLIPNLAIHMNRKVNEGYIYNAQKDMLPLFGEASAKGTFIKLLAENAQVNEEAILSSDLFLSKSCKNTPILFR